jgi:alginate O-acetyltransferase complex protein AlgI
MVFSSIEFIFAFLPLTLLLNLFAFRRDIKLSNIVLLIASLIFYFLGEKWFVLLMVFSGFVDFFFGYLIGLEWERNQQKSASRKQKIYLGSALTLNLGILFYFKYSNFFLENLNLILKSLNLSGFDELNVILPLGISFYTFQSMSYTIDVYRREAKYTKSFTDFLAYVTLFPQLVAGPIVRYVDVAKELVQRSVSNDDITYGIKRFIIGFGKKVIISNLVGEIADSIIDYQQGPFTLDQSIVSISSYTLQIYFDFSGYSDMAIGLGRILGFYFHENFNYPYSSGSIQDFWRRWHISLSTWFRDYLYIPLGGNKGGKFQTLRNLFLVFLLCGIWHGASYSFVIWGLFHGVFLALERLVNLKKVLPLAFLRKIYVLIVVMTGWVFFRAPDLTSALNIFEGFLSLKISDQNLLLDRPFLIGITLGCIFAFETPARVVRNLVDKNSFIAGITYLLVFFISILLLLGQSYNPFIYFRF